jgi:uncharacterized protein (DUF1697 family)
MSTYIVLLRGVMPTGKNKVPMAQLRKALEKAGFENVTTYIQSGNVILQSHLTASELEQVIHSLIEREFGGNITVIARTHKELSSIFNNCPFSSDGKPQLYFSILSEMPAQKLLEEFMSTKFEPDQVKVTHSAIYTLYATKYSDSKFNNNYFERKLKVKATTRNLNTMRKLLELADT